MARQRFMIEMGMGVDQHGQDPTVAAARAVRNAILRLYRGRTDTT
ncbi:Lin0512 family protein [Leptolyngbya sp. PCC 6406]|nr:Lin0512 family protein [Leptolyngbya sp. PCC 6406]